MSQQTTLTVNLAGNLTSKAGRYSQALGQMSQRGQRYMRALDRSVAKLGTGLDNLGNRYTAIISGAGLGLAGRKVAALETRVERLGINAGKSREEMLKLKQEVFEVAQEREIRVNPAQILSAIESIVEKTGDLAFAEANIRNIGMAVQATGADGQSIGEIMGEFQKMGLVDPSKVMEVLDVINVQGKEGAFTLQNLASLGPRVITAYTATGRSGAEAMREMGAALQMIRMGTGSSEMAATAFEATMRTLTDPKKIKMLQSAGIKIFDPKAAEKGKKALRPINELMAEIIQKVNGDATKLGMVFDAEAVRAFNAAAAEYQRTGQLETLQKFMDVQADGSTTMQDAARAARVSEAALQNLLNAWEQFQDNQLAEPIRDAADALNSLEPGTVQRWLEVGKNIAIAGAAAIALRKGSQAYGWLKGVRNGAKSGGLGGALAGAAGMGNATPVYVVNMPGGGMGGVGGDVGSGKGGRRTGKGVGASLGYNPKPKSRWAQLANKFSGLKPKLAGGVAAAGTGAAGLAVGGAGLAGYGVGTLIHKNLIKGTETEMDIGRAIAKTLAFFGHDESQAALDVERRALASLKIEVDDKRVAVRSVEADNLDMDISGMSMVGP